MDDRCLQLDLGTSSDLAFIDRSRPLLFFFTDLSIRRWLSPYDRWGQGPGGEFGASSAADVLMPRILYFSPCDVVKAPWLGPLLSTTAGTSRCLKNRVKKPIELPVIGQAHLRSRRHNPHNVHNHDMSSKAESGSVTYRVRNLNPAALSVAGPRRSRGPCPHDAIPRARIHAHGVGGGGCSGVPRLKLRTRRGFAWSSIWCSCCGDGGTDFNRCAAATPGCAPSPTNNGNRPAGMKDAGVGEDPAVATGRSADSPVA